MRKQLAPAETVLSDAVESRLDVECVPGFAEHLLINAARLWMELDLEQKQQLQQVLFPEDVWFDGEKVGTAATCLAFRQLNGIAVGESRLASPPGFEPGF